MPPVLYALCLPSFPAFSLLLLRSGHLLVFLFLFLCLLCLTLLPSNVLCTSTADCLLACLPALCSCDDTKGVFIIFHVLTLRTSILLQPKCWTLGLCHSSCRVRCSICGYAIPRVYYAKVVDAETELCSVFMRIFTGAMVYRSRKVFSFRRDTVTWLASTSQATSLYPADSG